MSTNLGDLLTLDRILELHGYKTKQEVPGYPLTLVDLINFTRDNVNRYGEEWIIKNRQALRDSMEELAEL